MVLLRDRGPVRTAGERSGADVGFPLRSAAMRRTLTLLALLAAAAGAGGGGGDEGGGDEDEVRRVARDYLTGLAAGNGRRACGSMTEAAQKAAVETVTAAFPDSPEVTCEQAVEDLSADMDPTRKRALLNPEFREVEVSGDRATVAIKGAEGSAVLARTGDQWRVTRSDVG